MFDVDGFEVSGATVDDLHAFGSSVVCYISAGSWENWRPDAEDFPMRVRGRSNGWPGERWLDVRKIGVLGPIMKARLDMCAAKGFDAVEFDNVDGYQNRTGFPLTAADQLAYNVFLANQAHRRGLSAVLKNDVGPDQSAAAVLRLRAERAVPPVPRVRPAEPVRERREGGLRRRVQAREVRVLPAVERRRTSTS